MSLSDSEHVHISMGQAEFMGKDALPCVKSLCQEYGASDLSILSLVNFCAVWLLCIAHGIEQCFLWIVKEKWISTAVW